MGATALKVVHLPKKVEVGTYEFPIQIIHAGDPRLGEDADGITFFGSPDELQVSRCILIAGRLGPKKTLEVVLHEVTHAINYVSNIDNGADEEEIAERHGAAWAQFWLDNPRLLRWLNYVVERIKQEREDG